MTLTFDLLTLNPNSVTHSFTRNQWCSYTLNIENHALNTTDVHVAWASTLKLQCQLTTDKYSHIAFNDADAIWSSTCIDASIGVVCSLNHKSTKAPSHKYKHKHTATMCSTHYDVYRSSRSNFLQISSTHFYKNSNILLHCSQLSGKVASPWDHSELVLK